MASQAEALAHDRHFMRAAIALSARGSGTTWPNPSVGCVIVAEGFIVGQGTTAPGGRPHAEVQALAMAGSQVRGACAYVTLEPCAHHGQTPPCAQALIEAGVARVVIACRDPDPRVDGKGAAMLRAAGIEVVEDVEKAAAERILAPFFTRVRLGRPLITLKLAATLDGKIATLSGESQWITGAAARAQGQILRGEHDAVMAGISTVLADNPDLSCRLPKYSARPTVRIVWDSTARLPVTHALALSARKKPVFLLHSKRAEADRLAALAALGVSLIEISEGAEGLDPAAALWLLGEQGLTSILVEGGAKLAASLLAAQLVDRLVWFSAPSVLGADGMSAIGALGIAALYASPRFTPIATQRVGDDLMQVFDSLRAS